MHALNMQKKAERFLQKNYGQIYMRESLNHDN